MLTLPARESVDLMRAVVAVDHHQQLAWEGLPCDLPGRFEVGSEHGRGLGVGAVGAVNDFVVMHVHGQVGSEASPLVLALWRIQNSSISTKQINSRTSDGRGCGIRQLRRQVAVAGQLEGCIGANHHTEGLPVRVSDGPQGVVGGIDHGKSNRCDATRERHICCINTFHRF